MSYLDLKKTAWMAALILLAPCAVSLFGQDKPPSSGTGSPASDQLVFDFRQAHNFAGFGTNVWLHPPHQPEQDKMMKDLKMRYVRVDIQWPIPLAELTTKTNYSVQDLSDLIKKYDTPQFESHISAFADEMKSLNLEMHFIFFVAPTCWLILPSHTSRKANPEYFENCANWIAAQVLQAKSVGLVPTHLEISNEPEGDWSAQYTPEQYDAYMVAVRKALDENGLQAIKIAGPGCGTGPKPTVPFVNAVENHGDGNILDILSVHSYDRDIDAKDFPQFDLLKPLMAKLAPGTQIFVSEYNNKSHYWGNPPYQTRPNQRGPNNGGDTADFGVSSVGDGLKLIAAGANSIFFWEASDQAWGHADFGMIALDGKEKPVSIATKIAFSIPWDVPAVGATGGGESLVAAAFKTPDGIRVSMVNLTPDPHAITATFQGLSLPLGTVSNVSFFDAKAGANATANPPTLTDGTLTANLPPRTLVSLLLK